MDSFAKRYGITLAKTYMEYLARASLDMDKLRAIFDKSDVNGDGHISAEELKTFTKAFFDNREPSDAQIARIIGLLDKTGSGDITWEDLQESMEQLKHFVTDEAAHDHSSFGSN